MKILITLLLSCTVLINAQAGLKFTWLSKVLVPGESVQVLLQQDNGEPFQLDKLPPINNGQIEFNQQAEISSSKTPNGRTYTLIFTCTPDAVGTMEIPSFSVQTQTGNTLNSKPEFIKVLPFSRIEWFKTKTSEDELNYGVLWDTSPTTPYLNQIVSTTLKLYTPEEIRSLGLPKIETKGLAAQTFSPALWLSQSIPSSGQALLKGKTWNVYSYESNVTPLSVGKATLGPGSVNASIQEERTDTGWGQIIRNFVNINLPIPSCTITSIPLPSQAPTGYQNAVGQFTLTTSTATTDITEGEPVSITVKVQGQGNLNIISCPKPENQSDWKLYPANKISTSDKEASGILEYQLLMKPLKEINEIPAFSLTYFNPKTKTYEVTRSKVIPLTWKGSDISPSSSFKGENTPPPAGIVPVEEMSDILTSPVFIMPDKIIFHKQLSTLFNHWGLSFIPAILIIIYGFLRRLSQRKLAEQDKIERQHNFNKLTKLKGKEGKIFLRAVGTFIETTIPTENRNFEILNILKERDGLAYIPEETIPPIEKNKADSMLNSIKHVLQTLPLLLFTGIIILSGISSLHAQNATESLETAERLIQQGDLEKAKTTLDSAPVSLNWGEKVAKNIIKGNISYKQNEPGIAALYYRKALTLSPDNYEARRNLAFIERKEGCLTSTLTPTQEFLEQCPYYIIQGCFFCSILLLTSLLAYMWAVNKTSTGKVLLSIFFALTTGILIFALNAYPHTLTETPEKVFVITKQGETAWHGASKQTAPLIKTIPQGTMAEVLAERGDWLYVRFANGIRGWIQTPSGQYLMPL